MDQKQKVLEIVSRSSTGLTEQQLADKAEVEGVTAIRPQINALEAEGLVRVDRHPAPARIKPTARVFTTPA